MREKDPNISISKQSEDMPEETKEKSKGDISDPYFLQTQFNLPREEWSQEFRELIERESEINQKAIRDTERELKYGISEDLEEEPKESEEDSRKNTFNRYLNGLGLSRKDLEDKTVLDLGSGEGEFVEHLVSEGITRDALGIDANLSEFSIKNEIKDHFIQGDFQKKLPFKNFDYIVSIGAVSLGVCRGEEIMDIKKIIKNSIDSLKDNGEIRIFPLREGIKDADLGGLEMSQKTWNKLLEEMREEQNIEYRIEPRNIHVTGKDNDIILNSVLIIRKKNK